MREFFKKINVPATQMIFSPDKNILLPKLDLNIKSNVVLVDNTNLTKNANSGYYEFVEVSKNIKKSISLTIETLPNKNLELLDKVQKRPRKMFTLKYINLNNKEISVIFPVGSKEKCIKELYEKTK